MDTTKAFENKLEKVQNPEELKQYVKELPKTTFTVRMDELRKKSKKSIIQIQTKTDIPESTLYALFNGTRNPKKKQIIQIAFAMNITAEELNELLKLAGLKELYPKNKEDAIVIFGINNGYELTEIDELLKENKCKMRFCEQKEENL